MKFTQIPANTFEELQLNAGVLVSNFTPTTGTITNSDILGATSGGVTFTDTPTFQDFGSDIDNCPKNTKELKRITDRNITLSGTYVTVDTDKAKSLIAGADVSSNAITPRDSLEDADFSDIWWVGDYSDKNGAKNGGYIAIHLIDALSTGGFSVKSAAEGKGQFAFTYTAHYSIENPDKVPYEVYIKAGTAEA